MLTNESNDEIDERIKRKYEHICKQLEIDDSILNSTWDSYRSIRNDHTLEVGGKKTLNIGTNSYHSVQKIVIILVLNYFLFQCECF